MTKVLDCNSSFCLLRFSFCIIHSGTSATLSVGGDFSHFATRLGLAGAARFRIESPFDYERQSLLYLPTGLPDPAHVDYADAVIDTALPLIEASRGGAFILFTSHRALTRGAQRLRAQWCARAKCSVDAPSR